ncbi:MAG: hypothetical protein GY801_03440 [bacterium]|nr:hypothetical protein [bacterium]
MSENDRKTLAAIIAKLDELEGLYRGATAPFQKEIRQASGLSADLLHQYRETLNGLQKPFEGEKLFATRPETEPTPINVCPQCAGTLEISTNLEPASQRGHVIVIMHYYCQICGYQDQDTLSLPKEIALQQQNLEAFMKGG